MMDLTRESDASLSVIAVRIESYVYTNERLFSEIEKTHPDVIFIDLDLYAKIDGIDTSKQMRYQFDVPVMYV
jgi:chemotaxis response regulator CheB